MMRKIEKRWVLVLTDQAVEGIYPCTCEGTEKINTGHSMFIHKCHTEKKSWA